MRISRRALSISLLVGLAPAAYALDGPETWAEQYVKAYLAGGLGDEAFYARRESWMSADLLLAMRSYEAAHRRYASLVKRIVPGRYGRDYPYKLAYPWAYGRLRLFQDFPTQVDRRPLRGPPDTPYLPVYATLSGEPPSVEVRVHLRLESKGWRIDNVTVSDGGRAIDLKQDIRKDAQAMRALRDRDI